MTLISLAGCGAPDGLVPGEPTAQEPSTGTHQDALSGPQLVPVFSWWSPSRADNFTTANPTWTSDRAPRSPDYGFSRFEGYAYAPGGGQPKDTVPLYSWYSPSRGDNFITSDPAWAGYAGAVRSPDYQFVRMEGYIHTKPVAGTVALNSWWSASRGDNFATTQPGWSAAFGTRSPDYGFVRTEGYLMRAPDPETLADAQAFGMNNLTVNGVAANGWRPLLLVRARLPESTLAFAHALTYYDDLVFGYGNPNIVDYFLEVSNYRFSWQRAGAYDITYDTGLDSSIETHVANAIQKVGAQGFNFAAFDTNHDGHVTVDELGLLIIDNGTTTGGATRGSNPGCVRPTSSSTVDVCRYATGPGGAGISGASLAGEEASFTTIAHELTHQLGAWDLYGSAGLSQNLTLMGATAYSWVDDRQKYHLDPWHKIQLGWVQPRIRNILDPGAVEQLDVPQLNSVRGITNESPVILYDPRRGFGEYFILEYRNASAPAGLYDANLYDAGLAVWYVKQDSNKNAVIIPGIAGGTSIDRAVFTLGAPSGGRGGTQLWKDGNGAFPLSWLDGSDTGIRVRAGVVTSSGSFPVEWTQSYRALASRIDAQSAGYGILGGTFDIVGSFGTKQGVRTVGWVGLYGGLADLPVLSWSPTQVTVKIPSTAPIGAGSIYVYADSTKTVTSNGIYVNLQP